VGDSLCSPIIKNIHTRALNRAGTFDFNKDIELVGQIRRLYAELFSRNVVLVISDDKKNICNDM